MCLLLELSARATEELFWRLTATNKHAPQLPPFLSFFFSFFLTWGRTQRKRTSQWMDTDLLHVERKRARDNFDGKKNYFAEKTNRKKDAGEKLRGKRKAAKGNFRPHSVDSRGTRRGKTLSSMRLDRPWRSPLLISTAIVPCQ